MKLIVDDLSDGAVEALLNAHLQEMFKYSPAESIHALDSKQLRDPKVTFWSVRIDGEIAGCGALKELDEKSAELKSMKTAQNHLRKGVAEALLTEILNEAKKRNYQNINLETGSNAAFNPAITLYKKHGFIESGPFADYKPDPFSRFFTKTL